MATTSWFARLGANFKAANRSMRFGGTTGNHWVAGAGLFGSSGVFDIAANAGDPADNSIVAATLGWVGRTYPEAPIRVMRETSDGDEIIPGHPLITLLRSPNPFTSGVELWTPLLASYILDGNAYLIKERTNGGGVFALWYVPHWEMTPRWPGDGSMFISHYDYRVDGQTTRYEVADVIHLRNGRDPHNPRKGLSQLKSALREIYTDNEITRYEAAMLRNRGTPGAIISPASPDQALTQEEAAWVSQSYLERTTGENQGKPLVSLAAIKVDAPAFSPAAMNLRQMRWTPEERISALIGIPAIVVGLGAGLEHGSFQNTKQAREAAYESYLIPTQTSIDAQITTQLMVDYTDDPALRVAHDYDDVRVLQPDLDAVYTRVEKVFASSIIDRATAKRELKLPVLPEDENIYFLGRGGSFVSGALTEIGPAFAAGQVVPDLEGAKPNIVPVTPTDGTHVPPGVVVKP